MKDDPATHLGRQLRGGRQAAHRSQRDLGEEIGLSQSVISRMELGLGGRIGLDVWAAAAEAVDLRLAVDLVDTADPLPHPVDPFAQHPCLRLLVNVAAKGGWMAVTDRAAEDEHTTVLGRRWSDGRPDDIAVAQAWPQVTRVEPAIERFRTLLGDLRQRGDGARVSGVVVIPATYANRRRVTESRTRLGVAFPTTGRAWFGALMSQVRRTPVEAGILWAFPDCARLRPAPLLPGWVWTVPGDGPKFMRCRRRRGG